MSNQQYPHPYNQTAIEKWRDSIDNRAIMHAEGWTLFKTTSGEWHIRNLYSANKLGVHSSETFVRNQAAKGSAFHIEVLRLLAAEMILK